MSALSEDRAATLDALLAACPVHVCPSCRQWTTSMRRHLETHDEQEHEELLLNLIAAEVIEG